MTVELQPLGNLCRAQQRFTTPSGLEGILNNKWTTSRTRRGASAGSRGAQPPPRCHPATPLRGLASAPVPKRRPGVPGEGTGVSGGSHPRPLQPRRGEPTLFSAPDGNVIPSSSCPLPGRTWGSGDNTSPLPPKAGWAGAGPLQRRAANSQLPPAAPPGPARPCPRRTSRRREGGLAGADVTPGARRGASPPRDPRGGRGAPRDPRPPFRREGAAPPSSAAEPRPGSAPRRCRSAPSRGRDPRPAEPPCPAALSRLLPGPSPHPRRGRDRRGPFPSAAGVNRTLAPPAPPNFGVSPPPPSAPPRSPSRQTDRRAKIKPRKNAASGRQ
uniref:basic proline-rich protein-like n=1 Tax=Lonchura striata TaxID=40157 RepID=UPI000B4DBE84|nr:basic proline-rich protein-like [Lonchura striata domestica]